MTDNHRDYLKDNIERFDAQQSTDEQLTPLPFNRRDSLFKVEQRLAEAHASLFVKSELLTAKAKDDFDAYQANIENYIGTISLPVGLAGPVKIKGSYANGDYYIPLATTEAALVASYNRGLEVMRRSGGCTSLVLAHEVQRAPFFKFDSVVNAAKFALWVDEQFPRLKEIAESTTSHGRLIAIDYQIDSNMVLLIFRYRTGLAAGQNMVTFATEAAYNEILRSCPVKILYHALEGNGSGDKKANFRSKHGARGYKVSLEVQLKREAITQVLGISIDELDKYMLYMDEVAKLNANFSHQAHLANALSAMFIACGQDVACVAEAAVGTTKGYKLDDDHMYWSVSLPNLIVGTVGGGTSLPGQRACLELVGLKSMSNTAAEFAELCAAVCLAGEISLTAAIANGNFSRAHRTLARVRKLNAAKRSQAGVA